jgi:hypothetical protein
MFTQHKLAEPVKSYLLGKLDDDQAEALETRCSTDPAFSQQVRDAEAELIGQYLKGALPQSERKQFEARYLEAPELKKRVEEVRSRRPAARPVFLPVPWEIALPALVLACWGIAWLHWRGQPQRPPKNAHNLGTLRPVAPLAVHLAPGLSKGGEPGQVELAAAAGRRVRLSLELPGRKSPVDCRVALAVIAADGSRRTAWTSPPLQSGRAGTSQEVSVELDSRLLLLGNYVAEVATVEGAVLETYAFRVAP